MAEPDSQETLHGLRLERRRPIKATFRLLRDAWAMVGIALVLLFGLELLATSLERWLMVQAAGKELEQYAELVGEPDAEWPREALEATYARKSQWEPYVYWRSEPYAGSVVNVDEQGLRRTVHPPPTGEADEAEVVRVFAFGGSTMWGSGARDQWTIPSVLARLLAEAGIRARVTNFGQTGYVSTQEVIALLRLLHEGDVPDVVVFYDGVNDVNAAFQHAKAGWTINEEARRAEFLAQRQGTLFNSLIYAASHSAIARLAGPDPMDLVTDERRPSTWDEYTQRFIKVPEVIAEYERRQASFDHELTNDEKNAIVQQLVYEQVAFDTARVYDANVAAVSGLARQYGFAALFYWQPVLFEKLEPSPAEQAMPKLHPAFVKFYDVAYRIVERASQGELPESEMLPRISQHVEYQGDLFSSPRWQGRTVYRDFCHPLEVGNGAIAEQMLADVVAAVRSVK